MSYDDTPPYEAGTFPKNRLDALLKPIVGILSDRNAPSYLRDDTAHRYGETGSSRYIYVSRHLERKPGTQSLPVTAHTSNLQPKSDWVPRPAVLSPDSGRLVAMLRIGCVYRASFSTTGQASLPHHPPDSFMVDFPASSHQRFGHTTIAIASKGFTNFLYSGTQPLIAFLVSRWTTVLIVPLPVDS